MDNPNGTITEPFSGQNGVITQRSILCPRFRASVCLKPASASCNRAPPTVVFCKQQPAYDVQWHGMKEFTDKKSLGRRF
jgi:hypothetical protein